ncbi:MAG: hypothetical protein LAN37_02095 [Acidobacteriia bacterium]|nr:hypothetical protein [Terriglobia bacterium]
MKKLLVVLALVLAVSMLSFAYSGKATSGSWTGWISDSKCGAKLIAGCTQKCIDAGEKAVFVSDKDKTVYPIANQDSVKGHAGHHVTVKGSMDNNTLTVSGVTMEKDQTMK